MAPSRENPLGEPPPETGELTAMDATAGEVNAAEAARMLGNLRRDMSRLQREIRLAIQEKLAQMTGRSLGTIESNRELAIAIHEMLDSHGLRVRCTQCGNPAILRVSPRANAPSGVFVFDHTIDGRRTFHGGRGALPELQLVAKPQRKTQQKTPRKAQAG